MPQVFSGFSKGRRFKRSTHLLQLVGLDKLAHRLPPELSGGQQQKIAIARALVNNPWIIVADEPTGSLDSKSSTEVLDILANLNNKSRRTVIMVTHNPDQLALAHRIVHLKDGHIIKIEKRRGFHHGMIKDDDPGEVVL